MKASKSITDTELAVLKLLWARGSSTAKEITEELYPDCTASDVGTVHSMLQRLESKEFVRRDRSSHAHRFSAALSHTEMVGLQLEEIADKLSDGSYVPFVTHLVEENRLDQDDLDKLRTLLDRHKSKRTKR